MHTEGGLEDDFINVPSGADLLGCFYVGDLYVKHIKSMKIATVCSGIGSPEMALKNLGVEHEVVFGCEIDKYARQTYLANFNPGTMYQDMTKEEWDKPEQYSDLFIGGIPCQAFSLAGKRLGELDKRGLLFYDFYRYVKNQRPKVFIIENVKGLLSDAGGKTFQNWLQLLGRSVNGHEQMFNHPDSLMYNLHHTVLNSKDFGVPQNRERVFIVGIRNDLPNDFRFPKGERLKIRLKDILEAEVDEKYYLSDKMLGYLNNRKANFNGGKINCKEGEDIASCINASSKSIDISDNIIVVNNNGSLEQRDVFNCLDANYHKGMDNHSQRSFIKEPICVAMRGRNPEDPSDRRTGAPTEQRLEPNSQGITNTITSVQKDNLIVEPQLNQVATLYDNNSDAGRIYDSLGISRTIKSDGGGGGAKTGLYLVPEATKQGYAVATEGDSINLSQLGSETRRGRVGVGVANTLDTACNQAVVVVNQTEIQNYANQLKKIYATKTKGNTGKILLELFEAINESSLSEWATNVFTSFSKDNLLQYDLYGYGVYKEGEKTKQLCNDTNKQTQSLEDYSRGKLLHLWKIECNRCTPQRRKSIKQLIRQFAKSVQELSRQDTQGREKLYGNGMQGETQRTRFLRETFTTLSEAWNTIRLQGEPIYARNISHRIRRLTPKETARLQAFPDDFVWPVSDSQRYKQCGNSITVFVMQAIIKNLLHLIR